MSGSLRPAHRPKLPSENKLVTVTLRILPATIRGIEEEAELRGMTEGAWKREAVEVHLKASRAMRGVS